MTLLRISAVFASMLLALSSGSLHADEPPHAEKPEVVQPVNKALDHHFDAVWKHIADTYAGRLPADWNTVPARFHGTMTTPGYLRGVSGVAATSAGDHRLRVLRPRQVDQYKSRLGGGYIGIGVTVKDILGEKGLRIFQTIDDGLGAKAGLQAKDEVRTVNGTPIAGMSQAEAAKLLAQSVNSVTTLGVVRDGKEQSVAITRGADEKLGIHISPAGETMFVIEKVFAGSPAEAAGVKQGDVLTHVNDNETSGGALYWIDNQLECMELGHENWMTVRRGDQSLKFTMKGAVVTVSSTAVQSEKVQLEGTSYRQIRIQNLDWVKLPNCFDEQEIAPGENLLIDLRDCSGDDPDVMARVALRLLERGTVLTYLERHGNVQEAVAYTVGDATVDPAQPATALVSTRGPVATTVDTVRSRQLTGKVVVLVDDFTTGTAEALATALQTNRKAKVIGRRTAGRNNLVVTTRFVVENEELLVQVPTLTVLGSDGRAAKAVVPERSGESHELLALAQAQMLGKSQVSSAVVLWVVLVLVFAVSLAYQLGSRAHCEGEPAQQRSLWKKWSARAGSVLCLVVAVVWLARSGEVTKTVSEKDKALAVFIDVLRNDKDTRNDTLGGMQIDRGPRDDKFDHMQSEAENNRIKDAEVEAACQLAIAIADGDFAKVRAIVTSYRGKPYARAQMTAAFNHAVYKCASAVDTMALNKWVEIQTEDLVDGQFSIWVSAAEEDEPLVQWMVRDFEHPRQFTSSPTKIASPEEVMRQLQHDFLNSLLSKHPRKVEGTN